MRSHPACCVLGTFCWAPSHVSASFLLWYLEMSKKKKKKGQIQGFCMCLGRSSSHSLSCDHLVMSAVRTAEGCDDDDDVDQGRLQRICGPPPHHTLFYFCGWRAPQILDTSIFLKMYSPPLMGLDIDLALHKKKKWAFILCRKQHSSFTKSFQRSFARHRDYYSFFFLPFVTWHMW